MINVDTGHTKSRDFISFVASGYRSNSSLSAWMSPS